MTPYKVVYTYMVLDLVHRGHIAMIAAGRRAAGPDGILVLGVLTDSAAMERKAAPVLSYEHRAEIAAGLKHVDKVIPQTRYSPRENILTLKPDILMESTSHSFEDIAIARSLMRDLGGNLEIIPYLEGVSSTLIRERIRLSISGL